MNDETTHTASVSLRYLFFTFLKVGTVSFGGNMGLISVVKNIMVDKDKKLEHEVILEALSIGSLLPGPLAVNVVAYIGYTLRKTTGAVVSMVAILLPAVTVMLILSWLYFQYGWNQQFSGIMTYITGAIAAIILTVAAQFYVKELKGNLTKTLLAALAIVSVVFSNSFALTMLLLVAGGFAGWLLKLNTGNTIAKAPGFYASGRKKMDAITIILWTILSLLLLLFLSSAYKPVNNIPAQIAIVFSGISLSLFGGGYVMIPIMQSLFVNELLWLTNQEFLDAITFSQVTPGPILVSATFIGYKLYGFWGALLATVCIFAPSAILMILVSKIYTRINHLSMVKHILAGVKAIVIGLIAGAAIKIGMQVSWSIPLAIITVISFVLSYFYKASPVYIILSCLLAGIILWYFNVG